MGIEPTSEAWEASILPLYDARSVPHCTTNASSRCQSGVARRVAQQSVDISIVTDLPIRFGILD
jgi:hypothetical protein